MKVQNPIIGRARGSAGGMPFCKNYDKNVARAKAFEVSNPKTQAQQTQRAFFAELTALCSDFSEDDLRALFPSKPKTMSRRNAISKQIAAYNQTVDNVKTILFEDIDTLGNAPVMDMKAETWNIQNGKINISWDDYPYADTPIADNYALFAAVNWTKGKIALLPSNASMSDISLQVDVPQGWDADDEFHVIMFMGNKKRDGKVALVGFGTMSVTKRAPGNND